MKVKDIDWQFVNSRVGYTGATWQAEVPGGMIIRHEVVEGADEQTIEDCLENDKEVPLYAWGKVTSTSMVFVPNPLQ